MSGLEKGITAFLGGLIVIALASTLVGQGKQTPAVLSAAGGAASGALLAAQGNQH
jgi:hypothetical protein